MTSPSSNTRPCQHQRHEFAADFDGLVARCRHCPITVSLPSIIQQRNNRNDPRALETAVRQAERDWYINALES